MSLLASDSMDDRRSILFHACIRTVELELNKNAWDAAKAAIDRFAASCSDLETLTADSSIADLGIGTRLTNTLEKYGFTVISQLTQCRETDLRRFSDISFGSIDLIRHKLSLHKLKFLD